MFVLATAFDQHAIEAFELGVVDYLLKPFTEERVTQSLRRLHERRQPTAVLPQAGSRIVARRKRSLVFLELREIGPSRPPTGSPMFTPSTVSSTSTCP